MKKFLTASILSCSLASVTSLVYANQYYSSNMPQDQQTGGGYTSSSSQNTGGYSSSGTPAGYPNHPGRSHHHERNKLNIFVNIPSAEPGYVIHQHDEYIVSDHHHRHRYNQLNWVFTTYDRPLPEDAVLGGVEANNDEDLFICRADYRGGIHPGKIVAGNCNIAWGGREISMSEYETLVSPFPLRWVASRNGYIPARAVEGGYEHNKPLYICQAQFNHGIHPGKVIGHECNISWNGREIAVSRFNVLVR